jgi:hypothetical protein
MPASTTTISLELDRRQSDGIDVSLMWNRVSGALTVTVFDVKTGDYFELPAPAESALDVFRHPFAYAAHRGVYLQEEPALAA